MALPAALDGVQSSGLVRCICEDDAVIREDSLNGDFLAAETSSDLDKTTLQSVPGTFGHELLVKEVSELSCAARRADSLATVQCWIYEGENLWNRPRREACRRTS